MKVLLYTEGLNTIGNSGLGKALKHQMKALELNNVEYTTDPKCNDYDVVHINFYGPKSYALAKKAHKNNKKVVYHAHSTEEDFRNSFICSNLISPLFKKWIIKCYSMGDVIISPTPYTKKLLENYGIKKPIYPISNGIDLEKFKTNEKLADKFRKYFNFTKDDKIIISCGIYVNRKGIKDFVELARRLPEYKFVWFGSSPLTFSTKDIKKAVHTKLDNLFFPGYVDIDILRGGYSGANLFVFPTYEENEGIPVMEASACKLPLMVRDIPVFDDWLIDNVNVYKAKDVDDFEKKIKLFMNGKLKSISKESYSVATDRDIKKIGKQLKEVYEEVLRK